MPPVCSLLRQVFCHLRIVCEQAGRALSDAVVAAPARIHVVEGVSHVLEEMVNLEIGGNLLFADCEEQVAKVEVRWREGRERSSSLSVQIQDA